MKNFVKLLAVIILASNFIACTSQSGKSKKLQTNMDSVSYAIGIWVGNNPAFKADKERINVDIVAKAMADAFNEKTDIMSSMDAQKILQTWSMELEKKMAEKDKADESVRIEEGKAFLEKNKSKEGVKTTESGLQYRVIKEGNGRTPTPEDRVKVHYEGRLINGDIFDSSRERGEPAEFGVTQVIKGWTETLQLMKEGSVYEIYVPSDLAYGARGAGDKIKSFSTLIFEVELIEILPKEADSSAVGE